MTAEELQQEIEQTRQQLGQTVDELAAKTDVKARARAKVTEVSGRVRRSELVQRRWPVALAAGVLIAGSVAVWRWKKT
ncbi:MAG: DUF3618 domain-containing protein [Streptosporangiaceae bacterium]